MSAPAIALSKLSKTFGRGRKAVTAVRDLDLSVDPGQVYGFLGPNGAGKSTTIRMIVDLVRPSSGTVQLFGADLRKSKDVVRRDVGALVEGALFYPHLSARENLRTLGRTRGRVDSRQIDELFERLDLMEYGDRPVAGYSMGMKQRLGVAAALLGEPKLVILDEPTNGLDPAGIREMRSFIKSLVADEGLTVFLSSHLLAEIEQVCDRVAIINDGAIVREGNVRELLAGEGRLQVEAQPLKRAENLLGSRWSVTRQGKRLVVCAARDETAEVVRLLCQAEVDVLEVTRQQSSLEDFFLKVTRAREGTSR